MTSVWRLRLETAVKNGQWRRWRARCHLGAQHGAEIGKRHGGRCDDARQHRQKNRQLRCDMVGALGISLAVGLAKRAVVLVLAAALIGPIGHVGARFGQGGLHVVAAHLVSAAGTGVRRRCQLN